MPDHTNYLPCAAIKSAQKFLEKYRESRHPQYSTHILIVYSMMSQFCLSVCNACLFHPFIDCYSFIVRHVEKTPCSALSKYLVSKQRFQNCRRSQNISIQTQNFINRQFTLKGNEFWNRNTDTVIRKSSNPTTQSLLNIETWSLFAKDRNPEEKKTDHER